MSPLPVPRFWLCTNRCSGVEGMIPVKLNWKVPNLTLILDRLGAKHIQGPEPENDGEDLAIDIRFSPQFICGCLEFGPKKLTLPVQVDLSLLILYQPELCSQPNDPVENIIDSRDSNLSKLSDSEPFVPVSATTDTVVKKDGEECSPCLTTVEPADSFDRLDSDPSPQEKHADGNSESSESSVTVLNIARFDPSLPKLEPADSFDCLDDSPHPQQKHLDGESESSGSSVTVLPHNLPREPGLNGICNEAKPVSPLDKIFNFGHAVIKTESASSSEQVDLLPLLTPRGKKTRRSGMGVAFSPTVSLREFEVSKTPQQFVDRAPKVLHDVPEEPSVISPASAIRDDDALYSAGSGYHHFMTDLPGDISVKQEPEEAASSHGQMNPEIPEPVIKTEKESLHVVSSGSSEISSVISNAEQTYQSFFSFFGLDGFGSIAHQDDSAQKASEQIKSDPGTCSSKEIKLEEDISSSVFAGLSLDCDTPPSVAFSDEPISQPNISDVPASQQTHYMPKSSADLERYMAEESAWLEQTKKKKKTRKADVGSEFTNLLRDMDESVPRDLSFANFSMEDDQVGSDPQVFILDSDEEEEKEKEHALKQPGTSGSGQPNKRRRIKRTLIDDGNSKCDSYLSYGQTIYLKPGDSLCRPANARQKEFADKVIRAREQAFADFKSKFKKEVPEEDGHLEMIKTCIEEKKKNIAELKKKVRQLRKQESATPANPIRDLFLSKLHPKSISGVPKTPIFSVSRYTMRQARLNSPPLPAVVFYGLPISGSICSTKMDTKSYSVMSHLDEISGETKRKAAKPSVAKILRKHFEKDEISLAHSSVVAMSSESTDTAELYDEPEINDFSIMLNDPFHQQPGFEEDDPLVKFEIDEVSVDQ